MGNFFLNHQRRLWKGVTFPSSPILPHAPSSPASCRGACKRSIQNQSIGAQALFVKATLVRREAVRVAFLPLQMGCPRVLPWLVHRRFLYKQPWPAPMASKEAQSPAPLFLSLLPPPCVSQAPGHRTEPFFSLGAAEATCLLVRPLHRTEFSSLDLCGLGRTSVQVNARLGLQLSPIFQRAQHCQRGTTASVCSRGAREDGWFPSSPALWAEFRGTLNFHIW